MAIDQEFERLIQKCCVRIESGGNSGTGFFVTPSQVLTCDHVVKADSSVIVDALGNQHRTAGVDRLPELDLAILELETPVPDASCAKLGSQVGPSDGCYSFGFPLAGERQRADARTMWIEGNIFERDEIVFNNAQIAPGQSGSPMVNFRTGLVCGVVSKTRDRDSDLGGRAISVDALTKKRPGLLEANADHHQFDRRWSTLARTNCDAWEPPVPAHYVTRQSVLEQLQEAIRTDGWNRSACALVAPSGFGKSTVAGHLFRRYPGPKVWIDLKQPVAPPSTSSDHLVVLDEVDSAIASDGDVTSFFQRTDWIHHVRGRLVVLTCRESLAKALMVRLAEDGKPRVVRMDRGFGTEEAVEFVSKAVLPDARDMLPDYMVGALNGAFAGSPFVWQMAADLINSDQIPEVLQLAYGDTTLVQERILSRWWEQAPFIGALTRRVAAKLCCLSSIGMSSAALAAVLNEPLEDVEKAVEPLLARGFVWRAMFVDRTLIPHSLLRSVCCKERENATDRERYRHYLAGAMTRQESATDFLTLLDAWIAGVRSVFVTADGTVAADKTFRRYAQIVDELPRIMPETNVRLHARFLADFFPSVVTKECHHVIPLARVFFGLPPHQTFAEILWHGAEHEDALASAYCIRAAAAHWSNQGADVAKRGAERMLRFCAGIPSHQLDDEELRVAAALAGAAALGYADRACETLDKIARRASTAVVTLQIHFAEHRSAAEALEFNRRYWQHMETSQDRYVCEAFLLDRGLSITPVRTTDLYFNETRAYVLGELAGSRKFAEYLRLLSLRAVPLPADDRAIMIPGPWPETFFRAD
jgi:hypothetical protein